MSKIQTLIDAIDAARNRYVNLTHQFTEPEAQWKSVPEVWSVVEITEHLFWAEQGGIIGMWKTLNAIRDGKIARLTESVHQNLSIETIIANTWQEKEVVPAVAAPRFGGPLAFWQTSLAGLQILLQQFGDTLLPQDLHVQAHPHPISGAMDFHQRLEFLRFHIDRHFQQAERILNQSKVV